MRVHILQHVPFEGPSTITNWGEARQLSCTKTLMFQHDTLPDVDSFDFLVVLGGPMGVHDNDDFPWLRAEVDFIRQCIAADKTMLGICLGAQLIAHGLGAAVMRNPQTEIGWFAVDRHPALKGHPLAEILPETFDAFHWHGDTFAIPNRAIPVASSEACTNQGFVFRDRIVGLQFHLETSLKAAQQLINHCRDELTPAPFIQSEERMLASPERFEHAQRRMFRVLDYLLAQAKQQPADAC
jgi:GMP synthase-like glutamine amidotransferase